VERGHIV